MKKKSLGTMLACVCLAPAVIFAGCNHHTHDYEDTFEQDATHHWYQCKECEEITGKDAHAWGPWVDATATTEKSECTTCHYEKVRPVIGLSATYLTPITQDLNKTYDGTAVSLITTPMADRDGVVSVNFYQKIAGNYSQTPLASAPINAGQYKVVASVPASLTHEAASVEKEFTIAKVNVTEPTITSATTFTYDGQQKSVTVATSEKYSVEGTIATNAGTKTVTVTLIDTQNYQWENAGNSQPLKLNWTIKKALLSAPTIIGSYTFTGAEQTAEVSTSTLYAVDDRTNKATNAGTYEVLVSLAYTSNYAWEVPATAEPGTLPSSEPYRLTWTINKLAVAKPRETSNLVYNGKEQAPTITESAYYQMGAERAVNAGTYAVTVWLLDSENTEWIVPGGSNVSTPIEVPFVIKQKTVSIQWNTPTADDLAYDARAKIVTAKANELVVGDAVNITTEKASGDNVNVGGTFTFVATDLTGEDAENYCLPSDNTTPEFTITTGKNRVTSVKINGTEQIATNQFLFQYDPSIANPITSLELADLFSQGVFVLNVIKHTEASLNDCDSLAESSSASLKGTLTHSLDAPDALTPAELGDWLNGIVMAEHGIYHLRISTADDSEGGLYSAVTHDFRLINAEATN